jgi:hypothetical protein
MNVVHKHDLATIFRHFDTRADFISGQPYGTGHINDTFRIAASQGGHRVLFTLQHVNTRIFKDGPGLMSNVVRISRHAVARLRAEGAIDASRRALQVIPAVDGKPYHVDSAGMLWRMYIFIDGVRTYDKVEQTRHAYEAARAFGLFQRLLADLPGARLNETIVNFHHTRSRFDAFQQAIRQDAAGRAASVQREIDFALAREPMCGTLLGLMASGEIPERVTHNDTKINNVLMDDNTDEGMCVIDLDTCMPGCALYDFGDMVRSGTNSTDEDDPDASHVHCKRDVFEALARGYLSAGDFLTPAERAHLVLGGKLMTFECGIRFLTDYLQGDTYFKVHREGHNLDRCRTQFALVKSIEDQEGDLQKFIETLPA